MLTIQKRRQGNRQLVYLDNRLANAPILVFLHGWGADKDNLRGIYQELTNEYRIISFDLPGFGESTRPPETCGSHWYAEEIAATLREIEVNHFSIVGHSFGGKIATLIAAAYPHNVQKLVLIGASILKPRRSFFYYWQIYTYKTAKLLLSFHPRKEKLIEQLRAKRGSEDYRSSLGMRDILKRVVNEDYSEIAAQVTQPVFLYWGELDDATPLYMAKKLKKIFKDSGLYIVPKGSHYPFVEDRRIISIIKKFILGENAC